MNERLNIHKLFFLYVICDSIGRALTHCARHWWSWSVHKSLLWSDPTRHRHRSVLRIYETLGRLFLTMATKVATRGSDAESRLQSPSYWVQNPGPETVIFGLNASAAHHFGKVWHSKTGCPLGFACSGYGNSSHAVTSRIANSLGSPVSTVVP